MKTLKTCLFLVSLHCACLHVAAQSDITRVSNIAIIFADSLEQAFDHKDWNEYLTLCYPGVVRYYGGKDEFIEHVGKLRSDDISYASNNLEVIQMLQVTTEWQCVIRRTHHALIDGSKAEIISYLVGQSKDGGATWKYVDVANNSPENLVYMMPDVSDHLAVPQRRIVFDKTQLLTRD